MEFVHRVSAHIVNEDRRYEFTFPNGAPAQEIIEALSSIHKEVIDVVKKNNEQNQEKVEDQQESNEEQE